MYGLRCSIQISLYGLWYSVRSTLYHPLYSVNRSHRPHNYNILDVTHIRMSHPGIFRPERLVQALPGQVVSAMPTMKMLLSFWLCTTSDLVLCCHNGVMCAAHSLMCHPNTPPWWTFKHTVRDGESEHMFRDVVSKYTVADGRPKTQSVMDVQKHNP